MIGISDYRHSSLAAAAAAAASFAAIVVVVVVVAAASFRIALGIAVTCAPARLLSSPPYRHGADIERGEADSSVLDESAASHTPRSCTFARRKRSGRRSSRK